MLKTARPLICDCATVLADSRTLHGRAYNLSNETAVNVIDLVSLILSKMNSRLEPDVRNQVSNEIEIQCLNAERAKLELGWRPLFTLDEALNGNDSLV
jgi:nucleoside-diphosphate-sugar epimerase